MEINFNKINEDKRNIETGGNLKQTLIYSGEVKKLSKGISINKKLKLQMGELFKENLPNSLILSPTFYLTYFIENLENKLLLFHIYDEK